MEYSVSIQNESSVTHPMTEIWLTILKCILAIWRVVSVFREASLKYLNYISMFLKTVLVFEYHGIQKRKTSMEK